MSTSRETISYSISTLIILGVILLTVVAYLYFLQVSVVHVVMRKEAISEAQDTRNAIALLETEFITAQHTIAARMAQVDGYTEESDKIFVSRGSVPNLVFGQ